MSTEPLQIQMLGDFSIRNGSAQICDSSNRSRKIWLLLAYFIYNRTRAVTPHELIDLLWGDEEHTSNPVNALKTSLHRVRSSLDALDEFGDLDFIVRRDGGYSWNPDLPVMLDVEEFDRLCQEAAAAGSDTVRLDRLLNALALYHGDFLCRLSSEPWVVPLSAHFHSLYVQAALDALRLLQEHKCWQEVAELCRSVLAHEPYLEEFYRYLMTALLQLGEQRAAVAVYDEMSELFLSHFSVMPSDQALALYRQAIRSVNDRLVSPGVILEQLREPAGTPGGALLCDYDVFKSIYHAVARALARSGDVAHLALISITNGEGKDLQQRSLDRVVGNLQDLIRTHLRRGDVMARCSVSQFIILLPQANYENSRMVCTRITKTFTRQYPHSPAKLHASVHPLEPN